MPHNRKIVSKQIKSVLRHDGKIEKLFHENGNYIYPSAREMPHRKPAAEVKQSKRIPNLNLSYYYSYYYSTNTIKEFIEGGIKIAKLHQPDLRNCSRLLKILEIKIFKIKRKS